MSDPRPARDGETLSDEKYADIADKWRRLYGLTAPEVGWLIDQVAALRAKIDEPGPCYVMADGECISPFKCVHGDGLTLTEFAHRIAQEETAALRAELADARAQGGFDLDAFSRENLARCESPTGFNHRLDSWSLSDWMTATLGELGEAANVAKKLNRVRDGIIGNDETAEDLRRKLASEIADAFIYLDLMAQSQGIRLREAVRRTFDAKSAKIGYRAARAASGEDAGR